MRDYERYNHTNAYRIVSIRHLLYYWSMVIAQTIDCFRYIRDEYVCPQCVYSPPFNETVCTRYFQFFFSLSNFKLTHLCCAFVAVIVVITSVVVGVVIAAVVSIRPKRSDGMWQYIQQSLAATVTQSSFDQKKKKFNSK